MLELTSSIIKIYSSTTDKISTPILYEKTKDIPIHEWWCLKENSKLWFSHKEFDADDFYVKWMLVTECKTNIKLNWIIWGDQILRHPFKNISSEVISNHRYTLYEELYSLSKSLLLQKEKRLSDIELVFTLLVIRHDKKIQSKKFVIDYIKNRIIYLLDLQQCVPSVYYRFLNTSLKDYMSCLTINDLKYNRIHLRLDYNDILEFNPEIMEELDLDKINKLKDTDIYKAFSSVLDNCYTVVKRHDKLTVSISGGVDSMVLSLCAYTYGIEHKLQVDLIHIQYNNRDCCDKEVKFLYDWSNMLRTANLYVRNINELKRRRETEWRELYENITKDFRFHAYSLVGGVILLGHNYEDSVENIITNIASKSHTDNLKGMKYIIRDNDVDLCRPFLDISKKDIIEFAHAFNIPYLQDSTPSWSKRGQIRDTIMPLLDKFDKNFIKGLYELSNTISFYKKEWIATANVWCDKNIVCDETDNMVISNKKQKLSIYAERILKIKIDDYLIRNKEQIWNYIWNKYFKSVAPIIDGVRGVSPHSNKPSKKGTNRIIETIEISKRKNQNISFPLNKQIYVMINCNHVFIYINFTKI